MSLALLITIAPTTYASSIRTEMFNIEDKYKGRKDIVMVVYYTEKNPHSVLADVKNLMHTKDPIGFFNPYWITRFHETKVDKKTGCGLAVGKWYAYNYKERGSWERIMTDGLPYITDNAAIFYMVDGGFTSFDGMRPQIDAIKNLCLK